MKTKENNSDSIRQLSAPVTIANWLDKELEIQKSEEQNESIFDLTKEKITVILFSCFFFLYINSCLIKLFNKTQLVC